MSPERKKAKTPKSANNELREFKASLAQYAVQEARPISVVQSEGELSARVVVVGHQPSDELELRPFKGRYNQVERSILEACNAPPKLVYLTYLVKTKLPKRALTRKVERLWCRLLFQELDIIKPKAVILLGHRVANVVLKQRGVDVNQFRKIRFVLNRMPSVNFFVSYSPEQVFADGGTSSNAGHYLMFDHMAVFQHVHTYFHTTKTLDI